MCRICPVVANPGNQKVCTLRYFPGLVANESVVEENYLDPVVCTLLSYCNVFKVLTILLSAVDITLHHLRSFFGNLCSNKEAKVVVSEDKGGGGEVFNQQVI